MAVSSNAQKRKQNYDIPNVLTINGVEAATKEDLNNATISGSYYPGKYLGYTNAPWGDLNTISNFNDLGVRDIAVDPADGTLWVSKDGSHEIAHVERNGSLINYFTPNVGGSSYGIEVDRADGGLWFVDNLNNCLYKVDQQGKLLEGPINNPLDKNNLRSVTVDISDGSLFIVDGDKVGHIDRSGDLISQPYSNGNLQYITLNQFDGSLFTSNTDGAIEHVSMSGDKIEDKKYDNQVTGIAFDPADGNLWLVDIVNGTIEYVRWNA